MSAAGDVQFGRIPTCMVAPPRRDDGTRPAGIMSKMVGEDAKVYGVICAFNKPDWTSECGTRLIRDVLGISGITVTRSIERLQRIGAIEAHRKGPGHPYTFHVRTALTTEGASTALAVEGTDTRKRPHSSSGSALTAGAEAPSPMNGSALTAEGKSEGSEIGQNTAASEAAAVRAEIKKAGVSEAMARRLVAEVPELNVEAVQSLAVKARQKHSKPGGLPGMLVTLIRDEGADEVKRLAADAERGAASREQARTTAERETAELREFYEQHRDAIEAYMADLHDDEIADRLRRQYVVHRDPSMCTTTPADVRSSWEWCVTFYRYRPRPELAGRVASVAASIGVDEPDGNRQQQVRRELLEQAKNERAAS